MADVYDMTDEPASSPTRADLLSPPPLSLRCLEVRGRTA